ncbi:MAG: ATP-dependent RecD-like DNA helicase [Clostridia bacterium]|nr:ATP-dependent RecD-like DNA helicase [Clostridia bacterium]
MNTGSSGALTEINGKVEDLIYINPDNGFSVIEFQPADGSETVRASGVMPELFPGEFVTLTGRMEMHRTYGETFKVISCTKAIPTDNDSLVAFLSCGLFSGVGEVTAKAIVDRFGGETADIILFTPARLAEVRNVSSKKAESIASTFREYFNMSETLKFFADLNITTAAAMAVYDRFGVNSIAVTKRNPYYLIDEVPQIGFKTADRIALGLGVDQNSGSRLCAFIKYYLQSQLNYGNVCFPKELLVNSVAYELATDTEAVSEALSGLLSGGSVSSYSVSGPDGAEDEYIFLGYISECEQYIADRLLGISEHVQHRKGPDFDKFIDRFGLESGFELNDVQISAVKNAVDNSFSVITGGPGTGKTTIIRALYQYLSLSGLKCMLCAPTGRAAKRMSEAVGIEAKTIHRMLEYSSYSREDGSDMYEDDSKLKFNRNESNPLETDVLIVDESSMLDTLLAYHMLKAMKSGTSLVMLGDKDQLPSVGPGNILKDIIASGIFRVTTLTYVYRQSDLSLIAYNAQRINNGLIPEMNRRDKDFFMIDCDDPSSVPEIVSDVVCRRLPVKYGIDPMRDIQVIIPGKKGECGVENMNQLLQAALNGRERDPKKQIEYGGTTFKTGDRVMQIKNNYDIEWESIRTPGLTGRGIFNGEMGVISEIDRYDGKITIVFDDDRTAEYGIELLSQLELCYAITVHKSQGSEFDYCVIPLANIPPRLCSRNILYTAVTRAKKMVVLAGDRRYLRAMIENNTEEKRFTCLCPRLLRSMPYLEDNIN